MSKSITESAAEILKASLGSSKQDPMVSGGAQVQDLGGQTPTTEPEAIGVKASAAAKEAPKPGTQGAPAEGSKKTVAVVNKTEEEQENPVKEETEEENLPELTEEEIEEYLNSLSEEELAELAALAEADETEEGTEVVAEETTEEETTEEQSTEEPAAPELTAEEVEAARKEALKSLVTENMGSCAEDIDALFAGETLSEEFKTKATTIFEAAVRSRVESIVEKIATENEAIMESTVGELEAQMTDQVDEYLNYVVEQWMEENKLAVESGLRAEIAEDFINGLKNLFTEHYIEVPEDKVNLVDELAAQVAKKEEELAEQVKKTEELTKALNESKAVEILRATCAGLTEVQVAKIKSLAESVQFTTEGEYSQKLAVIRENYFPTGKKISEAPQALVETEAQPEVSPVMDRYVQAISKTLPKV
jgi:hypothetical protein